MNTVDPKDKALTKTIDSNGIVHITKDKAKSAALEKSVSAWVEGIIDVLSDRSPEMRSKMLADSSIQFARDVFDRLGEVYSGMA